MSIVNALEITREAAKGGYAVGAFNITSINQMQGVIEAAIEKGSFNHPGFRHTIQIPHTRSARGCVSHTRQPGSNTNLFASGPLYGSGLL